MFARNDGSKQGLSVSLLFPDFSQSRFAYDGYGIGLTIGILSVLFLCLAGRNLKERFLAAGGFDRDHNSVFFLGVKRRALREREILNSVSSGVLLSDGGLSGRDPAERIF